MNKNKPLYEVRHITDFRDMIDQSVENYGAEPAFKLKDKSGEYYDVTYTEFRDDVRALGTVMRAMGFKGQKIAVMGMNSYKWVLTYFAATTSSNIIVPIDKELMFDDVNTILEVSETSIIFADAKSIKKLEEHAELLPAGLKFVMFDEENDRGEYMSFDVLMGMGRKLMSENNECYNEYLTDPIDADACSIIIFTSGTSGLAKGVMLSQTNVCFVVMSNRSVAEIGPGDQLLSVLPIHHTFECSLGITLTLYSGCCISFCEGLLHLMKNMQEVKPTVFVTVPLMLEKIHGRILKAASEKKGGKTILSLGKVLAGVTNAVGININDKIFEEITKNFGGRLRLAIVGAAAVRPDVVKDFKTFGIPIYVGYGLTECAPLVSCNHDALWDPATVGMPIPGVDVKIINADAQGVGEICVKGPNVMLGYYKDEEQTREVIDEFGWLHTGDLGTQDEDSIIRINGRIKNVIVTKNGKNIFPEEIEYYLNNNPLIAESMVVGVDSEDGLDTIVEAKIYPDKNAIKEKSKNKQSLTAEDIEKAIADVIKDINKKLPGYKAIKKIFIREDEFVKTTTAKIKRYANMDDAEQTATTENKENPDA